MITEVMRARATAGPVQLVEQAFGYRPESRRLIVVQHWAGFSHDRHAFVISINDAITARRSGPRADVLHDFRAARGALTGVAVDNENDARGLLALMGRPSERRCRVGACRAVLPIGGLFCTSCSAPQHPAADTRTRGGAA
jgi:hypothetical protein